MHMRESVFCLLTAAVLGCADQTPGVHLDQVASGPVQAGFAIRIPASYADRALVDFPLVRSPVLVANRAFAASPTGLSQKASSWCHFM